VHTDETGVTGDAAGSDGQGQLSDLLVIDLSRAVAGPHAHTRSQARRRHGAAAATLGENGCAHRELQTRHISQAWPHGSRSQGLLIDVQHASLGPIQLPGLPLRFFEIKDEMEVETTVQHHHPPPLLGASNASLGHGACRPHGR
jgi:hypothetical protein